VANTFRRDYEQLEIDDVADWATARGSYQRLVNIWHPDRYAQRPRERIHAQQRFIELTKSFNNLRTFYRAHNRLPYQRIQTQQSSQPKPAQTVRSARATVEESSLLRPRKESAIDDETLSNRRRLLWVLPGILMMLCTLGLLVVMDHNEKVRNIENAKEVLRNTEPSEFLPSAEELKKQSSRGAFVDREKPKQMGEQLIKDVFR